VRHAVIGTAGHVDHGKTSLVYALTDVQTDRLPEEQRRGITIELGFAPWRIRPDLLVSIIDAPGHRKLVHHMIAGASGIDIVLLVVAADEGVMPQTREHIAACELLGVERAIIAVTKADRADEELAELAGEEARELLMDHGIEAQAIACSAKTKQGIDALRQAVAAAIDGQQTDDPAPQRIRLSVDRAFSVRGSGTVVTGTLVAGTIQLGDSLRILSPGRENVALARQLHVHGEARDSASAPTRLAINLGGVTLEEVKRGDVLTNDPHVQATRTMDVWLKTRGDIRRGADASIFVGTSRSTAKIQPIAGSETEAGMMARLRLKHPLIALGGDRYVLRGAQVDGPAGAVIGGGVILDAQAGHSPRAAKRLALMQALQQKDASAAIELLARERSPKPILKENLASRFNINGDKLADAAKQLVAVGSLGWADQDNVNALEKLALSQIASHHKEHPLDRGLPRQTLREKIAAIAGDKLGHLVIERLKESKKIEAEAKVFRLVGQGAVDPKSAAGLALQVAIEHINTTGLNGTTENKLQERLQQQIKARTVLAVLEREGTALQAGGLWFSRAAFDELVGKVKSHFQQSETLSVADFKELTTLGRKQSIPLLELLDRERITRRPLDGSDRLAALP
jgi:selenocysteine-specific elongation factor